MLFLLFYRCFLKLFCTKWMAGFMSSDIQSNLINNTLYGETLELIFRPLKYNDKQRASRVCRLWNQWVFHAAKVEKESKAYKFINYLLHDASISLSQIDTFKNSLDFEGCKRLKKIYIKYRAIKYSFIKMIAQNGVSLNAIEFICSKSFKHINPKIITEALLQLIKKSIFEDPTSALKGILKLPTKIKEEQLEGYFKIYIKSDLDKALQAALAHSSIKIQITLLKEIIYKSNQSENYVILLKAAKAMPDEVKSSCLSDILLYLGIKPELNMDRIQEILSAIPEGILKLKCIDKLLKNLKENRSFQEEAFTLTRSLSNNYLQSFWCFDIVCDYLKLGKLDLALQVASTMSIEFLKYKAVKEIFKAFKNKGQWLHALNAESHNPNPLAKYKHLLSLKKDCSGYCQAIEQQLVHIVPMDCFNEKFPKPEKLSNLSKAKILKVFQFVNTFQDEFLKTWVFNAYSRALLKKGKLGLALEAAKSIPNVLIRSSRCCAISWEYLNKWKLEKALNAAKEVHCSYLQTQLFCEISRIYLMVKKDLDSAFNVALLIPDEYHLSIFLENLSMLYCKAGYLENAYDAIDHIPDIIFRAHCKGKLDSLMSIQSSLVLY